MEPAALLATQHYSPLELIYTRSNCTLTFYGTINFIDNSAGDYGASYNTVLIASMKPATLLATQQYMVELFV